MIYAIWDDSKSYVTDQQLRSPAADPLPPGHCSLVNAIGLPIGLFPHAEYDSITLQAEPGDAFVFFSDGILDARNQHGNTFGRDRAEQIVTRNCHMTADEIVTLIFQCCESISSAIPSSSTIRASLPSRSRIQIQLPSQPRNESDNLQEERPARPPAFVYRNRKLRCESAP